MNANHFQDLSIDFGKASREYTQENLNQANLKTYLYEPSMKKVWRWLNEYIKSSDNKNNQPINNIYSIVGERGSGKSSFVSTLRETIKEGTCFKEPQKESIYVLPKIDPTIFNSKIRMIEYFVTSLKTEVDQVKMNNSNSYGYMTNDNFEMNEKFNDLIRDAVNTLKNMRSEESVILKNKSGVEALQIIQGQNEFKEMIRELVHCFLSIVSSIQDKEYTYLSIFIDDLDLVPNHAVYETLQDLFKLLQYQKNLIVFTAYREEQLTQSVINELITDNANLLDREVIKVTELQRQAVNFIEKGLGRNLRVYLLINYKTKIRDVLNPFLIKSNSELNYFKDNQTVNEFLQQEVMRQTRLQITPIDAAEMTNFTYPRTLRTTLEYLSILHQMEPYQKVVNENQSKENEINILRGNVKTLKYFLVSKFRDYLPVNYFDILDEWINQPYEHRNLFLCKELFQLLQKSDDNKELDFGDIIKITKKESYNVSLGDVFTSIELFKRDKKSNQVDMYFVYAIKMLYSIEMLLTLTKALKILLSEKAVEKEYIVRQRFSNEAHNEREEKASESKSININSLNNYFAMNKGKIMPDGFWYNDDLISGNSSFTILNRNLVDSEEEKIEEQSFIKYMLYSDITAFGIIRKRGEEHLNYKEKNFAYRYRDFYKKNEFVINGNYLIDPYACLTDYNYVISDLNRKIYNGNFYFFYSMFDLDIFTRKNYFTSDKYRGLLFYTLDKIEDIFCNKLLTHEEVEMRKKMVWPLFERVNDNEKEIYEFKSFFQKEVKKHVSKIKKFDDGRILKKIEDYIKKYELGQSIAPKESKEFLRDYKKLYENWPINKDSDIERLDLLCEPGNTRSISKEDKEIIRILIEEFKQKMGD